MREILFRGKRVDDGEWIYGSYVKGALTADSIIADHTIIKYGCYAEEIDPKTRSQYTGLKDKDGKMIFEGDIITYGKETYTVIWDEHFCKFCKLAHNIKSNGIQQIFPLCQVESVKIIGNIHE